MIQLIFHGIGDYLIQNDWMALNKKKLSWKGELACQIHCLTYALPFLFITNGWAVGWIYLSHYILDRSNFVGWFLAIRNGVFHTRNFGFGEERPFAITIWLYIITDNLFHIICNYLIINYFK
jgi:hypothetical protein